MNFKISKNYALIFLTDKYLNKEINEAPSLGVV